MSARGPSDQRARYQERKLAGVCTYPSVAPCTEPLADGSTLCAQHLEQMLATQREARARQRAERRERGLCAQCGKRKSAGYRCPPCAIRLGRIISPSLGVHNGVHNEGHWRPGTTASDATTLRYRGRGSRGAPSTSVLDTQDVRQILAEVERAAKGLSFAHSELIAELPASQRRESVRAALSRWALAARWIHEMLARHGYEP